MPLYKCRLLNEKGELIVKDIFASSKEELIANHSQGSFKLLSASRSYKDINLNIFNSKVSAFSFLIFNRQLMLMLRSGLSLHQALFSILENSDSGLLKDILKKINDDIAKGISPSVAMADKSFPMYKIYGAVVSAGELSGSLDKVLDDFNNYLAKVVSLKRKIVSSLAYPVILILSMIIMATIVLLMVIPQFKEFFAGFNAQLPYLSRMFIDFSIFCRQNFLWVFILFLSLYFTLRIIENRRENFIFFHRIRLKIPVIGKMIKDNNLAVFSRTMSVLLSGGIPVPQALRTSIEIINNRYIIYVMSDMPEKINKGSSLSQVFSECKLIPSLMCSIVKTGEDTGKLEEVLDNNASFLEESLDMKIDMIVSLIEPIMIIVMGLVVCFMLLSVYLPIFSAVDVVR